MKMKVDPYDWDGFAGFERTRFPPGAEVVARAADHRGVLQELAAAHEAGGPPITLRDITLRDGPAGAVLIIDRADTGLFMVAELADGKFRPDRWSDSTHFMGRWPTNWVPVSSRKAAIKQWQAYCDAADLIEAWRHEWGDAPPAPAAPPKSKYDDDDRAFHLRFTDA